MSPASLKARMQVGQRSLAQAPQVQIGARRKADRAVAAGDRGVRQRGGLIERQAALSAPARARAVRRRSPSA